MRPSSIIRPARNDNLLFSGVGIVTAQATWKNAAGKYESPGAEARWTRLSWAARYRAADQMPLFKSIDVAAATSSWRISDSPTKTARAPD